MLMEVVCLSIHWFQVENRWNDHTGSTTNGSQSGNAIFSNVTGQIEGPTGPVTILDVYIMTTSGFLLKCMSGSTGRPQRTLRSRCCYRVVATQKPKPGFKAVVVCGCQLTSRGWVAQVEAKGWLDWFDQTSVQERSLWLSSWVSRQH